MDKKAKLRLYLNDKGGKLFTDDELDLLLEDEDCIYCAAAEGWTIIATGIDIQGTKKYTIGVESYENSSIDSQIKAALNNAAHFKAKCTGQSNGSFILRARPRM